jgi:Domain of unknown function (DUF4388)
MSSGADVGLSGVIETFPVRDALTLLAETRKTGCLRLDGDRGVGLAWLVDGRLAGVEAQRAVPGTPIEEALLELLLCRRGSFVFHGGVHPPGPVEQVHDVADALDDAGELLEEWHRLETVVPSLSHQVTLRPELEGGMVTIDTSTWSALTVIGDGTSVGHLADALDVGPLEGLRRVHELLESGVAVLAPPDQPRHQAHPTKPRPPVPVA